MIMYVKKTTNKVLPTVVYPELYQKRFCEAMERYFTVVPDKWTGLEADLLYDVGIYLCACITQIQHSITCESTQ